MPTELEGAVALVVERFPGTEVVGGSWLEEALSTIKRGWPVFPLAPRSKIPAISGGFKAASVEEDQIRRWAFEFPDAGLGVATGGVKGLVVLDVDPRNGGDESLFGLEQTFGELPPTVESLTGGGGRHLFFYSPEPMPSRAGIEDGLDVKGSGGYVAITPTVHPDTGRLYEWELGSHPDEMKLAPLPRWLAERVTARQVRGAVPEGEPIREGGRNDWLTSKGGYLRRAGFEEVAILAALTEENRNRCTPPLAEEELQKIARSVCRYEPADDAPAHLTDAGNAIRFASQNREDVRYVYPWRAWLVWDGRRWIRDQTGDIHRLAKATVATIYEEAARAPEENRKALARHAAASESEARIRAMVSLTQSEPGIPVRPADLDADPFSLNVLNGVVDLRTGALKPHQRLDLITRLAPVPFDPDARFELWESFLVHATGGDAELSSFLQRATGYSLTGDPREEVLFFVHGPTAAGKTTFAEALKGALGDYSTTADFETFLARRDSSGPRNDVARLHAARFVVSVEVEEGRRLAEGLVKMLTGGDTVAARFLYSEAFEFRPQMKLWLISNHAPKVRDDDDALWRRILRVPLENVVPEADRDPEVKALLRNPAVAGPAVLAWAVKGCLAWQREGLNPPAAVTEATAAYREAMNPLAEWFSCCCEWGLDQWTSNASLRDSYERWGKESGERNLLGAKAFAAHLRTRGCAPEKVGGLRGWRGVKAE
jgi:putative DNA primase/helicase